MATPGVTLTATLTDLLGNPNAGKIVLTLDNYGSLLPQISGDSSLAPVAYTAQADASGHISITIWGNYQISPAGTFYTVTLFSADGSFTQSVPYVFPTTGTFDLSSLTPLAGTNPPMQVGPKGDSGVTGPLTPSSASTAGITGQVAWDSSYIYVCISGGVAGAATWKKAPLSPA
jgi:hypothetical protein